jgi:hypothetical protein
MPRMKRHLLIDLATVCAWMNRINGLQETWIFDYGERGVWVS